MKQLGLLVLAIPHYVCLEEWLSHFSTINSEESNESKFCSDVFLDSTPGILVQQNWRKVQELAALDKQAK